MTRMGRGAASIDLGLRGNKTPETQGGYIAHMRAVYF